MMKKYTIPTLCLFVVLVGLPFFTACTYDYFEDETNYSVYVPKANTDLITENYRVEDVRIFIYQGHLEQERNVRFPYQNNARTKVGNYNFRLYPRAHDVYCFSNTAGFDFHSMSDYDKAGFGLSQDTDNSVYSYPNELTTFYAEYRNPTMNYPGPAITDTVKFEKHYAAKIHVAFKNLTVNGRPLTASDVSVVKIEASGVGLYQKMSLLTDSINTRSSRYTLSDKVKLSSTPYISPYADYQLGVHHYFFPSLSDANETMKFNIELQSSNGTMLYQLSVDVTDVLRADSDGVLHTNQTVYIGVDGDKVYKLNLDKPQDWNSEIISGGTNPGDGGIEV